MPRPTIHPGEILMEELAELGVTPTELSRQINLETAVEVLRWDGTRSF